MDRLERIEKIREDLEKHKFVAREDHEWLMHEIEELTNDTLDRALRFIQREMSSDAFVAWHKGMLEAMDEMARMIDELRAKLDEKEEQDD